MAIFLASENDEPAKARLAQLLKELRGQKTQREFAKLLGVSYTALQDWEKQVRLPREENLKLIAQMKGWPQEELLHFLFLAEPQAVPSETDPLEEIYSQVQVLSSLQKQRLRNYIDTQLSQNQDCREAKTTVILSDREKYNLHLLLKASLKGQNPTEAMTRSGIDPELFTDVYLKNYSNRLIDYTSLQAFTSLCCRVLEWRGNQLPKVDRKCTYQEVPNLLYHDLAENRKVFID